MKYTKYPSKFDSSEAEGLACLASDAAEEIDSISRVKDINYHPIRRLSRLLGVFARELDRDPMGPDVFCAKELFGIVGEYANTDLKTTKDLASEVRKVSLELSNIAEMPESKRRGLLGFCINLTYKMAALYFGVVEVA